MEAAQAGTQAAVAVAVALGDTLAGMFMPAGANLALKIGFKEHLHDDFRGSTKEIRVTGFGQQVCQW